MTSELHHLRIIVTEESQIAIEQDSLGELGGTTDVVIIAVQQVDWVIAQLQSLKERIVEQSELKEQFI